MTGLLFDLDGTLLDTLEDLKDATNYALRVHGYLERTLAEVRSFVGNGALTLIRLCIPEGEDPAPVLQTFRTYYSSHCRIKTRPYDGIPDALRELREKYPVAIVSNKPDAAVKGLCDELFPGIYALGERPDYPRKPAPDMVRKAMDAIGVEKCVYIGDSEVDILTARNAGVSCLSVTWGFRDEEDLLKSGAEHLCHTPADLPQAIDRVLSRQE